ncbi:MAG: hypothetical protein ACXIUQ_19880 [Cecembia sp.]
MSRVLLIGAILMLWSQISTAQDNYVSFELNVFDHPKEKEYIQKYEEAPFLLLQALEPIEAKSFKKWDRLLKRLDKRFKKHAGEVRLLSDIFYITHQLMLSRYETHANFSSTLTDGIYDCVTGTGMYAILLERFKVPYIIIETDEHVYLKGEFEGVPFIMESTFPLEGLIVGLEDVLDFEKKFIGDSDPKEAIRLPNVLGAMSTAVKPSSVFNKIGIKELAGLQYYNDAVLKFNEKAYQNAYIQLIKAAYLYPSPRITDLKEKMEMLLGVVVVEDVR